MVVWTSASPVTGLASRIERAAHHCVEFMLGEFRDPSMTLTKLDSRRYSFWHDQFGCYPASVLCDHYVRGFNAHVCHCGSFVPVVSHARILYA